MPPSHLKNQQGMDIVLYCVSHDVEYITLRHAADHLNKDHDNNITINQLKTTYSDHFEVHTVNMLYCESPGCSYHCINPLTMFDHLRARHKYRQCHGCRISLTRGDFERHMEKCELYLNTLYKPNQNNS